MNLYLVKRADHDIPSAGENRAHVIVAKDEYEARLYAGRVAVDESAVIWFEDQTTVQLLGQPEPDVTGGVILTDHYEG